MAGAYENADGSPKYGERVEQRELRPADVDELWANAMDAADKLDIGYVLIHSEGNDSARLRTNVKESNVPRLLKAAARSIRRGGK